MPQGEPIRRPAPTTIAATAFRSAIKAITSIRRVARPSSILFTAAATHSGNGAVELRSSPHTAHVSLHVDGLASRTRRALPGCGRDHYRFYNESRALRVDVPIHEAALPWVKKYCGTIR